MLERDWQVGFKASSDERLPRDGDWSRPMKGASTGLDRALVALSTTKWPLVFEEIKSIGDR